MNSGIQAVRDQWQSQLGSKTPEMSHIQSLMSDLSKQKAITEMWYERQLFYKWCFDRLSETSQKNLKKVYELETGREVNFERE